jgi:UDP-N-acetylmuramate--alanine ligase
LLKFVTFGINNEKCNFVARNISFDINGYPKFDVYHNNNFFFELKLSIIGRHNILNALACIALCNEYKISKYVIKDTLSSFTGVNRRFELIGSYDNIFVYNSDYKTSKVIE